MSRSSRYQKKKKSLGKKILWGIFAVVVGMTVIGVGVGASVYFTLAGSIRETYQSVERESPTPEANLDAHEPFSVLLLGVDTGDLGRTEQGRSDTMMVATVSPENNQTTLVSIPRDTYLEIVGRGMFDKANHAYAFGGPAMAMDTIEQFLDIPINHFVSINMHGIQELVDAVGGITVHNDLEFTQSGYHFGFGAIQLNGAQALAYIRMRYDDPRGDYGRQERQREVVEAIIRQGLSFSGITQFQSVLNAMEGNLLTDISFSDMQSIALNYRSAFTNINSLQLQGLPLWQNGISYQKVDEAELLQVQQTLQQQLNNN